MGRLLEAATTFRPNNGGVKSGVDKLLDTLNEEDRDDLLTLLRDTEQYGSTTVTRLIYKVHGIRLGHDAVIKWRRRNVG